MSDPETWDAVFDDKSRLTLKLADTMCGQTSVLDTKLIAELRASFTEVELAELLLVAGQANLNNRAGNAAKQLLGN